MSKLCIIPCGAKKIWDIQPGAGATEAKSIYVGGFHNSCQRYARTFFDNWIYLDPRTIKEKPVTLSKTVESCYYPEEETLIKKVRSWWKDGTIPRFIGRKTVDWSVFEYGSHIPMEFHQDFEEILQGTPVPLGTSKKLSLVYDGHTYEVALANINQQSQERRALQLRYDSNKELKDLMRSLFSSTYDYIQSNKTAVKGDKRKEQVKVPEELEEYIEFYSTDESLTIEMKAFSVKKNEKRPNIWWVNQGTSNASAKADRSLWAPLVNSAGHKKNHWETMNHVQKGDIVLHYVDGEIRQVSEVFEGSMLAEKPASLGENNKNNWNQEGRLVKTDYYDLIPSVPLHRFVNKLQKLVIKDGPIKVTGGVNLGYLFRLTIEGLHIIQDSSPETNWPDFTRLELSSSEEVIPIDEIQDVEVQDIGSAIQNLKSYIQQKGFTYPANLIETFYLSLKTKPFVILAGISGTGKTRLVRLFAESMGATRENKQFVLVPVRPDWSDPSDLIGYHNLNGDFVPGKLTEIILEASKPNNRTKPYFFCLDEMNLARVEHYFSDMLSVLESQERFGEQIVTDTVVTYEELNYGIPDNLFIIGTVNMDETTHPFSKKVLDRANTIEFNYINLESFPELIKDTLKTNPLPSSFLRSDYLFLQDVYGEHTQLVQNTTEKLVMVNRILEETHTHIGFRVRDAVCFFMIYNERFGMLLQEDEAFDAQLLQKILPRIQGSNPSIKRAIIQLLRFCEDKQPLSKVDDNMDISTLYEPYHNDKLPEGVRYEQSARKLAYMLRRMDEDGFTSFWLS